MNEWSLVDSNDAREPRPKLTRSHRYNSASSTAGKAGQDSLVINGAIAELVTMTDRRIGNVA